MDGLPLACNRTLLFAAVLLSNVGCVGLNIPSGRHHDSSPAASTELFPGGPRRLDHALFFAKPAAADDGAPPSPCRERALAEHLPYQEEKSDKSLPSVPWPRFHPVPTSPAFAGLR